MNELVTALTSTQGTLSLSCTLVAAGIHIKSESSTLPSIAQMVDE